MIQTLKNIFGLGPKVDYAELVKNGAVILDVRTKNEFNSGHIKGSVNIPVENLSANLKRLKKKDQPIIAVCASGMRSGSAKRMLKSAGFTEVYNGGGWMSLKNRLN